MEPNENGQVPAEETKATTEAQETPAAQNSTDSVSESVQPPVSETQVPEGKLVSEVSPEVPESKELVSDMKEEVKDVEVEGASLFERLWNKVKSKLKNEEGKIGGELKALADKVYPSDEQTIFVESDADYGGAHTYHIQNCLGHNPATGKTEYADSHQTIQFIQKNMDGSVIPGVQSEQLIYMLLDRHEKLNQKFNSSEYINILHGLKMFIAASENRVKERMARGVMGDLKK